MAFPTPDQAIGLSIDTWEGLWQANPADRGNYAHCANGTTQLVGTMRGVTPDVYAEFHGIDPCAVTVAQLQAVTLNDAVAIAMKNFYAPAKFQMLTWSPLVDITFDACFMSGTGQGVKMLQECIGAHPDGGIGPQTAEALDLFLESNDIEAACNKLADVRAAFYVGISPPGSKNAQFQKGWLNRCNWARPAPNGAWWSRWVGWTMPHPAGSSKATGVASPTA
jgi:lysozyme family protein